MTYNMQCFANANYTVPSESVPRGPTTMKHDVVPGRSAAGPPHSGCAVPVQCSASGPGVTVAPQPLNGCTAMYADAGPAVLQPECQTEWHCHVCALPAVRHSR